MTTDTPRTDALVYSDNNCVEGWHLFRDLCRQLERELSAVTSAPALTDEQITDIARTRAAHYVWITLPWSPLLEPRNKERDRIAVVIEEAIREALALANETAAGQEPVRTTGEGSANTRPASSAAPDVAVLVERLRRWHEQWCALMDNEHTCECDCGYPERMEAADALEQMARDLAAAKSEIEQGYIALAFAGVRPNTLAIGIEAIKERDEKAEAALATAQADADRFRRALSAYQRGVIMSSDGEGYISVFLEAIDALKDAQK